MHPLKHPKIVEVGHSRICVSVKRKGKNLHKDGSFLREAKADTVWAELPKGYKVIDFNGKEIPASGKFLITVETIDPYHLITDYNENNRRR